jgi:hypothetical protein
LPFSVPGFITAHSQVRISNFLQGAEANALFNLRRDAGFSANLIAGYRYLQLAENLSLTNNLDGIDFAKGLFVHFEDNFETRNTFNGGQIGLGTQFRSGRWFLDASGKIALGQMNEVIDVFGRTAIMPFPGSPMKVAQEGFFAQQSNSGLHSRNVLAYIPEVTLNVGVNVTSRISAFVGYNFIYVSNVLRPGDQIDRSVNLTQSSTIGLGTLIGPARPTTQFNNTDFWAQGINFGFRVRF